MTSLIFITLFLVSTFSCTSALNVHIVCHTHDDVGWLKTVDQYYVGANNSIQHAGVQYILDSVIPALVANPLRKFIYVEQAFFQRWYRQQSSATQSTVQQLVKNGQLEFINGGWCMHDEAATHYVDMIDQTTLGHKFITDEFGVSPRIGWQIDPFGHSATQAALLSGEVGFDALFFGRIDYQDHDLRISQKNMEFVWSPSASLGSLSSVFTGAFQNGNYGPPDSFCYDLFCADPPIQDDDLLEDVNVQERVDYFVKQATDAASHTLGDNIMFTMGSDFQFENANEWYKNLDKLITYVNRDGRVNAFYSTPSAYVDAKHAESNNFQLTVKTDDFFPYADGPAQFWTGYFTSRALLKRYVRVTSSLLQTYRQIDVLSGGDGTTLTLLAQAQAVAQHHDAVSGTSKQHVAFDYAKRLARGVNTALVGVNAALASWTLSTSSTVYDACPLINVTVCATTTKTNSFVVVAYNSILRERVERVEVPVSSAALVVLDASGATVASQVLPATSTTARTSDSAPYVLTFVASVPALGFTTFTVEPASLLHHHHNKKNNNKKMMQQSSGDVDAEQNVEEEEEGANDLIIANQYISVNVSASTGLLVSITNLKTGAVLPVQQDFLWYASYQFDNIDNNNPSGAYIFRTNGSSAYPVNSGAVSARITSNGPVVWSIEQQVSTWYTQVLSFTAADEHVRVDYTVGPIPIDDDQGKEIVTRFSTGLNTNGVFYTDSNGREFVERKINYRPTWNLTVTEPVAGNYYPMNAAAYVSDGSSSFSILNDRSQGVGSLDNGQLEIMIHRRTLRDDRRGVGEPMNETESCTPYPDFKRIGLGIAVSGTHYLVFQPVSLQFSVVRPLQSRIFSPLYNSFTALTTSSAVYRASHALSKSFAGTVTLPVNVELMTLQTWSKGVVLVRLAHVFASSEDATLSAPVSVDLSSLFPSLSVSGVSELSLTGNRLRSDVTNKKLTWNTNQPVPATQRGTLVGTVATITPMEIRTFALTVSQA